MDGVVEGRSRGRTPAHWRAVVVALSLSVASLLAACSATDQTPTGSATEQGYQRISPPQVTAAADLPEPTGPVVLVVERPDGSQVQFDLASLESLGLIEYDAMDSQGEGRMSQFQGVLMSAIVDTAGIGDATTLTMKALNDYSIDIPMSDVRTYPVMIATRADGERMTIEHYGPLRVVYPTQDYTFDPATYDPRWIWQLDAIEAS